MSCFSAWSCYKLINETESFHEASHICSTLGNGEVNYNAVLAADKNSETNLAFKQMMKMHNVSEAYIGVKIEVGLWIEYFECRNERLKIGQIALL